MVFKMLILLGFFTVQEASFIHSDIHRSIVNRVNYCGAKPVRADRAFRMIRRGRVRGMRRNVRAKHSIFDRLEWEPPVCFHSVTTISNCAGAD